jgi:hypothetical protein
MTKINNFHSRRLRLICRWLFFIALFSSNLIYAQDPAQYGTPFSGVPDPRDASVYQVNMRCFSSTRNLQGVINRLDNIKNLGVKVIQLMPVQPVSTHSKSVNSPYSWKAFQQVGSEFGSLTTLRALVDGAHARGMAVIMDWVANQTGWDHPWITANPTWYVRNSSGVIQNLNGWTDVAALDMNNTAMRTAMIGSMRYWIFTANIDGFRCDYANHAPTSFWSAVISNLRGITSHKLLMLAEGDGSTMYSEGFDISFSWNFYNNLKSIQGGSSATLIGSSNTYDYNGASGSKQVARWLTNHDIYGSEGSPYNIFGGKASVLGKFVITAYMHSVPFIYNGEEVGNTVAMPFPFTGSTVNWNQDVSITPEITKILAHRNYSVACRRGTLTDYTNSNVCFFKKVNATETVFVMVNLRNSGQTITLPSGIANVTMYDAFTNAAVGLTGNYYLAPYQYVVLKMGAGSRLPEEGETEASPIAIEIYPNPSHDKQLNINIPGLAENEMATVTINDINGKKTMETKIGKSANIDHQLPSGLYFINVRAKGINVIKKIAIE